MRRDMHVWLKKRQKYAVTRKEKQSFCRLQRIVRGFLRRELPASMKRASHSGLYSSFYRLNPADIRFRPDALTSICTRIMRLTETAAGLPANLRRRLWTVSG